VTDAQPQCTVIEQIRVWLARHVSHLPFKLQDRKSDEHSDRRVHPCGLYGNNTCHDRRWLSALQVAPPQPDMQRHLSNGSALQITAHSPPLTRKTLPG
jgi:hypothetical protein